MYHFTIFFPCCNSLTFSSICFDIFRWLPVLSSLMFISFPLVSYFSGLSKLWLHSFAFSCISFMTISSVFLYHICCHFLLTLCREESFYCTVPITPVKREVEELDTIEEVSRVARLNMHGLPCQNARGYHWMRNSARTYLLCCQHQLDTVDKQCSDF